MTFNPPVAVPSTKKKVHASTTPGVIDLKTFVNKVSFVHQDHFTVGPALLDFELQRQVDRILTDSDIQPDFTDTHTRMTLTHAHNTA